MPLAWKDMPEQVAAIGVAVSAVIFLASLIWMVWPNRASAPPPMHHIEVASQSGHAVSTAGDHSPVHIGDIHHVPPVSILPWHQQGGAPQFRFAPGFDDQRRLLMEFYVEHAAPFPVQFRAKWEGLVEGMEWAIERTGTGVLIMPHPGSNPPKYQLKPVNPNAASDTVTFVLRF